MKQLFIFMAAILTLSALTACNDDKGSDIPRSLDNSVWVSAPDEQGEQIQILFSSTGEAHYNVWLNGKQEITSEANYTYSYSRPNIKLTPKQADMPTFTGRIISNGTYATMHLTSTDGATMIVLTHQIDKSDTIWQ